MNTIDVLYMLYFMQKNHSKVSPTFVEKKLLNEYLYKIKLFKRKNINDIKKKIEDDFESKKNSYLGWSAEHYEKQKEEYLTYLEKLAQRLQESEDPLEDVEIDNEDLNVHTQIELAYGTLLPKSDIKDNLCEISDLN